MMPHEDGRPSNRAPVLISRAKGMEMLRMTECIEESLREFSLDGVPANATVGQTIESLGLDEAEVGEFSEYLLRVSYELLISEEGVPLPVDLVLEGVLVGIAFSGYMVATGRWKHGAEA